MNNLSSYCGLVDAEIRASDKDLPVPFLAHFHTISANLCSNFGATQTFYKKSSLVNVISQLLQVSLNLKNGHAVNL
jgi:hypothetical protein